MDDVRKAAALEVYDDVADDVIRKIAPVIATLQGDFREQVLEVLTEVGLIERAPEMWTWSVKCDRPDCDFTANGEVEGELAASDAANAAEHNHERYHAIPPEAEPTKPKATVIPLSAFRAA